jgi:hypothetical protein
MIVKPPEIAPLEGLRLILFYDLLHRSVIAQGAEMVEKTMAGIRLV